MPTSSYWDLTRSASRTDSERSEEHTSELQSPCNLVCRLLLEKKKNNAHVYSVARTRDFYAVTPHCRPPCPSSAFGPGSPTMHASRGPILMHSLHCLLVHSSS